MGNTSQLQQTSFSTQFAIGCFGIGTILFAAYMLFPSDAILIIGLYYLLFAIALNLIILAYLIIQFFTNWSEKTETLIKILIVLSNIPIALFYFYIVCSNFNNSQNF